MSYKFSLRNNFEVDYTEETVNIKGTKGVLDNKGEFDYRVEYEEKVSMKYFINFCKICIGMECSFYGRELTENNYGIKFYRETYDDRYFQSDKIEMALGEVYIMFELVGRKMNLSQFKIVRFGFYFLYCHPNNCIVVTDNTCLNVAVLAPSTIYDLKFSPDGKNGVGFNKKVKITSITNAWMEKSAYPYIALQYRDNGILFTYYDFEKFKKNIRNINYIFLEESWGW